MASSRPQEFEYYTDPPPRDREVYVQYRKALSRYMFSTSIGTQTEPEMYMMDGRPVRVVEPFRVDLANPAARVLVMEVLRPDPLEPVQVHIPEQEPRPLEQVLRNEERGHVWVLPPMLSPTWTPSPTPDDMEEFEVPEDPTTRDCACQCEKMDLQVVPEALAPGEAEDSDMAEDAAGVQNENGEQALG